MALLNIEGEDVEVMKYVWTIADQDLDSGRNLAGYLERNILEHSVNTLNITIPPQNATQRAHTLQLLHRNYLTIQFLSPYTNTIETHTFYHGDLESELYWNVSDAIGTETLYNAMQVKLVEY